MQPVDFLRFAAQHFDSGNAEVFRASHAGESRGLPEQRRRTQNVIQPTRHRKITTEKNTETAEKNRRRASFRWFVGDEWQVKRNH